MEDPSSRRGWFRRQRTSSGRVVTLIAYWVVPPLLILVGVLVPIVALWIAILALPALILYWLLGRRLRRGEPRGPHRPV
jgi:Na+-driven multidrug efflux pump